MRIGGKGGSRKGENIGSVYMIRAFRVISGRCGGRGLSVVECLVMREGNNNTER